MSSTKALTVSFYCPSCKRVVEAAYLVAYRGWRCVHCDAMLEACCDVDPALCRCNPEGKRLKYYDDSARPEPSYEEETP